LMLIFPLLSVWQLWANSTCCTFGAMCIAMVLLCGQDFSNRGYPRTFWFTSLYFCLFFSHIEMILVPTRGLLADGVRCVCTDHLRKVLGLRHCCFQGFSKHQELFSALTSSHRAVSQMENWLITLYYSGSLKEVIFLLSFLGFRMHH
jgi:hypothetical protein